MTMDTTYMMTKREPRMTDEQRVEAASSMNLKLDPVGKGDQIMVIVGFSVLGLTTLLVVLAWLKRSYGPIKAKHLLPITYMNITSILWFCGNLVNSGLVNTVGVFSNCKLWIVWFRLSNTYMNTCFMIIRLVALHRIFILKKPCRGWSQFIPYIIMIAFILTFDITAQLVSPEITIKYIPGLEVCRFAKAFHYCCFAISGIIWVTYTVYVILIRNINSSFNEVRETLIIYFCGTSAIITTIVLHVLYPRYTLIRTIRLTCVASELFGAVIPIWVLLGKPVFMCLFHHDEYLAQWEQKLSLNGLAKLYRLQDGEEHTTSYSMMEDCSHQFSSWNTGAGSRRTTTNATAAYNWKEAGSLAQAVNTNDSANVSHSGSTVKLATDTK